MAGCAGDVEHPAAEIELDNLLGRGREPEERLHRRKLTPDDRGSGSLRR
jgi:hypothetical protein